MIKQGAFLKGFSGQFELTPYKFNSIKTSHVYTFQLLSTARNKGQMLYTQVIIKMFDYNLNVTV